MKKSSQLRGSHIRQNAEKSADQSNVQWSSYDELYFDIDIINVISFASGGTGITQQFLLYTFQYNETVIEKKLSESSLY